MNRKSPNYERGRFGHRRFGGTGNFGNYNSGSGHHDAHEEDRFERFRDPHGQEKGNSNNMPSRTNGGRRRKRNRYGGTQHFGNETRQGNSNWYDDRRSTVSAQREQLPLPIAQAPVPNAQLVTSSPAVPPSDKKPLEDKMPIIKNIKQEKIYNDSKPVVKPQASSVNSSEASKENNKKVNTKNIVQDAKSKSDETKLKSTGEPKGKVNSAPSSSSSTSEDEEINNKASKSSSMSPKTIKEKKTKVSNKSSKKKKSCEEDLICLGKLERNIVIEDDVSDEADQEKLEFTENLCVICDSKGHVAFECQMICKNCSAPYHNMKTCPKPANLSLMLQSFMEFCMGQMNQFNPEQKFVLPTNANANESIVTKENKQSENAAQRKKVRNVHGKIKTSSKKVTKRKRRRSPKSSDSEEEDEEDDETEEHSSESETESESSKEIISSKDKKKRRKTPVVAKTSDYHNSFVPPFSSFPAFGAAAAAYNPLLLRQLIHGGGFGIQK